MEKSTISYFLFLLFGLEKVASLSPSTKSSIIIGFNPYIQSINFADCCREDDVAKMLDTISKSFCKISAIDFRLNPRQISAEYIPIVAAKHNAKILNKTPLSLQSPHIPLEVYLTLLHKLPQDGEHEGNASLFDVVFGQAEKANLIWNGTVTTILFGIDYQTNSGKSTWPIIYNYLSRVKNAKLRFPYRVATYFSPMSCNISLVRVIRDMKEKRLIAPGNSFLVVLHKHSNNNDYIRGVELSLKIFQSDFEICLSVADEQKLDVEMAFETSWTDKGLNGSRNFSALVYFWENMENWGERKGVKVFIDSAFDYGKESGIGWWRTVDYDKLIFEEKRATLQKQLEKEKRTSSNLTFSEPPKRTNNKTETSNTIIIVAAAVLSPLVSISAMGLIIIFIYRKLSVKMRHPLLTTQDVDDFMCGQNTEEGETEMYEGFSSLMELPYNKKLEISSEKFELKNNAILGLGNFGVVCKATLKFSDELVDAAAKKLKSNSTATALRGLLSEIKVLSYLGKHENIICLLGASTERLKEGDVFVFTELCVNGSLDKYLRNKKPEFCTHSGGHYDALEQGIESKAFCKNNLHYKWSCEIARGMEYVASKSVVHADLATRNILLGINLTAKISDFGLSRRLYEYESYKKNEEEPMPWRWMAPESLSKLIFNEKTDVWAFGITLWEIYTLASVPYGGLVWNAKFYKRLIEGLRLDQPENCPDQIFELMMKCWNVGPNQRLNFREVVQRLI